MHCPYCRNTDTRVLDSRVAEDGGVDPPPAHLPAEPVAAASGSPRSS